MGSAHASSSMQIQAGKACHFPHLLPPPAPPPPSPPLPTGAAIRVFESLELWDNVITCYRLTGKKALAEELVQRRWGGRGEEMEGEGGRGRGGGTGRVWVWGGGERAGRAWVVLGPWGPGVWRVTYTPFCP